MRLGSLSNLYFFFSNRNSDLKALGLDPAFLEAGEMAHQLVALAAFAALAEDPRFSFLHPHCNSEITQFLGSLDTLF